MFSLIIYNFLIREFDRMEREQIFHAIHEYSSDPSAFHRIIISPQVYDESRSQVGFILILTNIGILLASGAAGYFLAGRTLRPIKEMVDQQNQFITDASHELRTPITSLRSEIEVYIRGINHSEKETKDLLKSNLEEIKNLSVLSDNLIQLAQYQNINGKNVIQSVSLREIMQLAIKKMHILAKQKTIAIKNTVTEYNILGEKESFIQLFSILLDNAIKYSPKKSTITITTKSLDHHVLIHITDQGIGIDKKDLPHIFDRFYRTDSSRTKQKIPGYGLGLSIAKKIVNTYRGTLQVKSELGKGTTFIISLPYERVT